MWSSLKRSFMGITCHWIDEAFLERRSSALACKRFQGGFDITRHTSDAIAKMNQEVMKHFKLGNKVKSIVTQIGIVVP
ncbi:hypothetical protein OUZ56_029696 [Daphnia magna]|uniref:Uncharacterized protein n=1 Tax=Daphnia magna TaxID=35525 RepID=A0ABR0B7L4_9CRUS|nr:hypothetical protein OUZ56_029696 [Daphnia magna]